MVTGVTASTSWAEQPAMSTSTGGVGGAISVEDLRGDRAERRAAAAPVPASDDRVAGVAAGGDGRLERHLAQQRRTDLVGQRLAAALAEQRVATRRGRT